MSAPSSEKPEVLKNNMALLESIGAELAEAAQELAGQAQSVTPEAIGLAQLSSRVLGLAGDLNRVVKGIRSM